jgi:spermidine synthase
MPTRSQQAVDAPATAPPPPLVRTRRGRRTLEFSPGDVQSEMRLAHPDALVLAYSRAMMGFALFVPHPRHILMAGLGGGSLAKFCYRHFPQARITVVELRADVIALRAQFHVPPDDQRFQVVHGDAADYIAAHPASADVLLVDGFDASGLPPTLGSARFYADCRHALRDGGVMAANIFSYDPGYRAMLERLRQAFGGRVCWFHRAAGNNHILFALKAPRQSGPQRGRRVDLAARRFEFVARHRGLGAGWLNRVFTRLLVAWLARPRVAY